MGKDLLGVQVRIKVSSKLKKQWKKDLVRFAIDAARKVLAERQETLMEQYIEPAGRLNEATKTFSRIMSGLIEEADAINRYEQRMDQQGGEFQDVIAAAQREEMKHFAMQLEAAMRQSTVFRQIRQDILFKPGNIVEAGEIAEKNASNVIAVS